MRFSKLFIYLLLSVSPLACRRGGTTHFFAAGTAAKAIEEVQPEVGAMKLDCDTIFYLDGSVAQIISKKNGIRHGEVSSYWQNGSMRAHANYVEGKVHGTARQWYRSGALFKELNYEHGIESGSQKAWRENGVLYANYVAKDGRHYGLRRSNLCFQLEGEVVNYDGVRGKNLR